MFPAFYFHGITCCVTHFIVQSYVQHSGGKHVHPGSIHVFSARCNQARAIHCFYFIYLICSGQAAMHLDINEIKMPPHIYNY